MPQYYNFGITAASAENPDSFELYKFLLFTSGSITREEPRRAQNPYGEQPNINVNIPPDTPAPSVDQTVQFQDLHNRLQTLAHSIDSLYNEVRVLADKSEGRHQELSRNIISPDRLDAIDIRLHGIETIVRGYQGQFSGLESSLKDTHSSLAESLPKHMGDRTCFTQSSHSLSYNLFNQFLNQSTHFISFILTILSYNNVSTPHGAPYFRLYRCPATTGWVLCHI